MSEDIQKESTSPQQEKPPQERVNGQKPDLQLPPYPKTIVAAGVLLIVLAGLIVLGLVWVFCTIPSGSKNGPLVVGALGAVAILLLAIQIVRAKSTAKGAGRIGCVFVGLGLFPALLFVLGALGAYFEVAPGILSWGNSDFVLIVSLELACLFLLAAVTLSAGVLFWVGRAPYRAWRNAKNARKENGPMKKGDA